MSHDSHDADPAWSAQLRRQLAAGEQVLWQGRPLQGLRLHRADLWMLPFALMWGGFALHWEWSVLRSDVPAFFVLWGIPFVLLGLYLMVGRFFFDARRRASTRYVLTTERVLLAAGQGFRRIESLPLRLLPQVSLHERADGRGTITLGSAAGGWAGVGAGLLLPGWPGGRRAHRSWKGSRTHSRCSSACAMPSAVPRCCLAPHAFTMKRGQRFWHKP